MRVLGESTLAATGGVSKGSRILDDLDSRGRSMFLVGDLRLCPVGHELESCLWERLVSEVPNTGPLSRTVRYETGGSEPNRLKFFGVEVESLTDIPDGMMAWELTHTTWTVWQTTDRGRVEAWHAPLRWRWRAQSPAGRVVGEFAAHLPPQWSRRGESERREFWLSSNAYVGFEGQHWHDDLYLAEYDPEWPSKFQEMADWLQHRLGPDLVRRIEHYGSTAVPGMCADPAIDILVEVPSFDFARRRVVPALNEETWEYWFCGHMSWTKREGLMGVASYRVRFAPHGDTIWDCLAFRDYLRSHPEQARQYADLKWELAAEYEEYEDGWEGYAHGREAFIEEMTAKALAEGYGRHGPR